MDKETSNIEVLELLRVLKCLVFLEILRCSYSLDEEIRLLLMLLGGLGLGLALSLSLIYSSQAWVALAVLGVNLLG